MRDALPYVGLGRARFVRFVELRVALADLARDLSRV